MFEPETIELTPSEKEVDKLLRQAHFYIQTYRSIEAFSVLDKAMEIVENENVQWRVKSTVFRDCGQAHIQMGHIPDGLNFFIRSYEIIEDCNDKAATAGMIARYYLQEGNTEQAAEYAEKALQLATASELKSFPYQIQGGIAVMEGAFPRAIELMNKAAEFAEKSHCLTDLAMIIMDLSTIFINMEKPETALSEICRAERYIKDCRNFDLYIRCTIRKAKILYLMKKDEEAKALIFALDEQKN